MEKDNSSRWLNITKTVYYVVTILFTILLIRAIFFTTSTFTPEKLDKILVDTQKIMSCKIDYCGFHYEGICMNKEDVLQSMQNLTRYHNCDVLTTWGWLAMAELDDNEYVDLSIAQNKVIEDRNPDMELFEEYDRNLDEIEEE